MLYISTTKSKNQLSSHMALLAAHNQLEITSSMLPRQISTTAAVLAVEDIWNTKKQCHRQFRGALGFCFTYSFLLRKFFWNKCLEHYWFNMVAAQEFQAKYQVSKVLCVSMRKKRIITYSIWSLSSQSWRMLFLLSWVWQ